MSRTTYVRRSLDFGKLEQSLKREQSSSGSPCLQVQPGKSGLLSQRNHSFHPNQVTNAFMQGVVHVGEIYTATALANFGGQAPSALPLTKTVSGAGSANALASSPSVSGPHTPPILGSISRIHSGIGMQLGRAPEVSTQLYCEWPKARRASTASRFGSRHSEESQAIRPSAPSCVRRAHQGIGVLTELPEADPRPSIAGGSDATPDAAASQAGGAGGAGQTWSIGGSPAAEATLPQGDEQSQQSQPPSQGTMILSTPSMKRANLSRSESGMFRLTLTRGVAKECDPSATHSESSKAAQAARWKASKKGGRGKVHASVSDESDIREERESGGSERNGGARAAPARPGLFASLRCCFAPSVAAES